MARAVPPSFVEIGPKLRVAIPHKPKTAKNRGESGGGLAGGYGAGCILQDTYLLYSMIVISKQ